MTVAMGVEENMERENSRRDRMGEGGGEKAAYLMEFVRDKKKQQQQQLHLYVSWGSNCIYHVTVSLVELPNRVSSFQHTSHEPIPSSYSAHASLLED